MSCNCNHSYPCSWDFAPSIYISAEDPLKADGMSVKLKYGDGLYLDENGNLCAIGGSGETGVDDVKVNGSSVVSNRIANVDLTPYALSATVQSQVTALDEKVDAVSAQTTPLSAGSGVTIVDNKINVAGGNVVNSLNLKNASPSGTVLTFKQDGRPNDFVAASFGKINGQNMVEEQTFKSFDLLSGLSIAGTDATITNYKAVVPSATTSVLGVVKVDNAINSASTNPVQNKVIKEALDEKANGAYNLVALTQAEYDALAEKDENTIYMIKEA